MEVNELFKNDDDDKRVPQLEACCCKCMPKRYLLALLTFTGFVNVYTLRVNLSVAMVAMVSSSVKQFPNGTSYTVSSSHVT